MKTLSQPDMSEEDKDGMDLIFALMFKLQREMRPMNTAMYSLLSLIRSNPGHLDAVVKGAIAECGEELFKLGMAIYRANPKRTLQGPPPGATAQAELHVVGVPASKVQGMRAIRVFFPDMTLPEAAAHLWSEIKDGKPLVYAPTSLSYAWRLAENWKAAGFTVEVRPVGDALTTHEQDFRSAVAMVATAG